MLTCSDSDCDVSNRNNPGNHSFHSTYLQSSSRSYCDAKIVKKHKTISLKEAIPTLFVPPSLKLINKPIVWILGGPGSGKGTQCDKIVAKYGFTHLSTGDLLRDEVRSGSERGKNLAAIMKTGGLVPNDVVLDLLKEAMEARALKSSGFLIDGYPREKSQGMQFERNIAPVTTILYFEASFETLTKRLLGRALSSGRADDNEETIKLRLRTFLDNNQQVLDQYPSKLNRINAERTVDVIFSDVTKILDPIVARSRAAGPVTIFN